MWNCLKKIHTLYKHIFSTKKHKCEVDWGKTIGRIPTESLVSPGTDASWEGIQERELYTPLQHKFIGKLEGLAWNV